MRSWDSHYLIESFTGLVLRCEPVVDFLGLVLRCVVFSGEGVLEVYRDNLVVVFKIINRILYNFYSKAPTLHFDRPFKHIRRRETVPIPD